jgi:hypothetical protein
MNSNWLIFFFFCLSSSVVGQTTEHEFRYRNNSFKFDLPNDFRTSHFHYTEGDYNIFYRLDTIAKIDTTSLTLHFGSMVKLPHLSDSTYIVEEKSRIQRSGKQIDGRFWRELNLSRDINIYYKNASKEEKMLFDSIIWKFSNQNHGKPLTNTTEYDIQNLYTYSVNILLDTLSENIEGTFILEGNPAAKVHPKFLTEPVINSEQKRIFDHKSNLLKEFNHLIGRDLIRLRLRPVYIEHSRVKLPIFLIKSVYKTRNKSDSGIFRDGAWTFIFYLNQQTNSFELEAIEKGITL